jgi:hypothetical protein
MQLRADNCRATTAMIDSKWRKVHDAQGQTSITDRFAQIA